MPGRFMEGLGWPGHGLVAVSGLVLCGALCGCAGFFPPVGSSGSGGGGTTNPGTVVGSGANAVYVGSTTNQTMLGYAIGTNTLTAVPNSLNLGYAPQASVVTRAGKFLYVAQAGGINLYLIGPDGSLSVPAAGAAQVIATTVAAMDVSPDGQWLFGLDTLTQAIDEWQINSDGTLTALTPAQFTLAGGIYVPKAIRVAPSGGLIVAACGTAGEVVFSLDTANGSVVQEQTLGTESTQRSDNSIAIDSSSSHLYIATSGTGGGLGVYTIGVNGLLTSVSGSPFATGQAPNSVALDGTGGFVYVANRADSTISGYAIGTTGTLTAIAGSPFASGSQVNTIGTDSTGKYLLAAAVGGSPDLTMYSENATTGALASVATTATGTDPAGATLLTLTH